MASRSGIGEIAIICMLGSSLGALVLSSSSVMAETSGDYDNQVTAIRIRGPVKRTKGKGPKGLRLRPG
jgi:hypothetical protein